MHDIWNPWHGCVKCSEGCQHCYMYFLDRVRDRNGADIYKMKSGFTYPLQRTRNGHYKIQSGELIRVWEPIPQEELYVPHYRKNCKKCGSKLICNGCADCGRCKE